MKATIYLIIIALYAIYILWTWNNTKSFEVTFTRISYIAIGTLFILFLTYIIFRISRSGINYPNKNMIGVVRNIILIVFVPVNGFITLPRIANIIGKIKNDEITGYQLKKKIIIFTIVVIIAIVIEGIYFKDVQNGIIQIFKLK